MRCCADEATAERPNRPQRPSPNETDAATPADAAVSPQAFTTAAYSTHVTIIYVETSMQTPETQQYSLIRSHLQTDEEENGTNPRTGGVCCDYNTTINTDNLCSDVISALQS